MEQIIATGAEAVLIKNKDWLIKKRIKKSYRLDSIDEKIRKQRTRAESRILEKASPLIKVPKLIEVNEDEKEITMEFIQGEKLSETLDTYDLAKQKKVCEKIGKSIAKLHEANIIHGDLTTSNLILKDNEVYIIDFGLSFISLRQEDKAVDLHLIKQALEARHFEHFKALFDSILKGYKSKNSAKVLQQLEKVEKRGRYKH